MGDYNAMLCLRELGNLHPVCFCLCLHVLGCFEQWATENSWLQLKFPLLSMSDTAMEVHWTIGYVQIEA